MNLDATKTHEIKAYKHPSPLISCRFDPTGEYIFFGAQDYQVWRWEIETGKTLPLDTDCWVRGIAFGDEGKTVLTAGFDGRLIWWPVSGEALQPIRAIEAHNGWVRAVAVSRDNSLVATVGNDNLVKLWRMADGQLVREMSGHERHVYHVAFHPDGKQLATGDLMGNLFHWEVETGKLARKLAIAGLHKYDKTFKADIGGFRDLRFSDDGKWLACAGITNVTNAFAGIGNPLVEVWDWEAGKQKIAHVSKDKLKGVAWGVAFHPGGFIAGLSGGGGGGFLLFWKPDTAEEFHKVKLPNIARDMDQCVASMQLATVHFDGHLRLHKMAEKAE